MCTYCKIKKEIFRNPHSQESMQFQEIAEDIYIVFENRYGSFCLVVCYLTMSSFLSKLITDNLKFLTVKEGIYMKKETLAS